jgi:hypothetical protein
MVDSGCEWRLGDCESSGSSSDDDAYASIPAGRLADTTSGPSLSDPESESTSDPKCDGDTIDAGRATLCHESVLAGSSGDGSV